LVPGGDLFVLTRDAIKAITAVATTIERRMTLGGCSYSVLSMGRTACMTGAVKFDTPCSIMTRPDVSGQELLVRSLSGRPFRTQGVVESSPSFITRRKVMRTA
jgi:hypothetical protein